MNLLSRKIIRFRNRKRLPIKVFWYRNPTHNIYNFGDEVTADIVNYFWGLHCEWTRPENCELLCVGSILENFSKSGLQNKVAVWGSGFIESGEDNVNNNLDFYAVRGKSTLSRIRSGRDVTLGDPALLISKVYPYRHNPNGKIGIVLHYADAKDPIVNRKYKNDPSYKIIHALQHPKTVAKEIASCRIIFSSSLHGLIFADSYGVPNYWMPLSDKVYGGKYKFKDYCSAIDKELETIDIGKISNKEVVEQLTTDFFPAKNLHKSQKQLLRSFPFAN